MRNTTDAAIRVLGTERNTWMWSFLHASNRIARAVVADHIEPSTIETFPLAGYDEKACRALAVAAGLDWNGDDDQLYTEAVGAEDVEVAVQAIQALPEASISSYDDTEQAVWMIYPETLAEHGTSVAELRAAVRGISIREAAALIVAADEWWSENVRAEREARA